MWFFLALQAAGPPVPASARRLPDRPCPVARPGEEIVVCARPQEEFRLGPLPDRYVGERTPPKAAVGIAGVGTVSAEAEQGADAQGGPVNRAMIRLTVPLGGSKR